MSQAIFLCPYLDDSVPETLNTSIASFWKLGEATGAARADSAGSNTLADNGTVTQVAGAAGNASHYAAASTQFNSIASNSTVTFGTGVRFTITGWVKLDSKAASRQLIAKWTATGNQREYELFYNNSPDVFQANASGNGTTFSFARATTFGSPSTATWYFIACQYDGANLSISVNNGAFNTAAFSADVFAGTGDLRVGANGIASPEYMDGAIQAVGVWKRVLTAAEITRLYNGGAPLVPTNGVWATAA